MQTDAACAAGGIMQRLKVLMLPPIDWERQKRDFTPESGPDPDIVRKMLARHEIDVAVIDPYPFPRNPLGNQGSVIRAVDPWRTLHVLLRERRHDLIVPVFEGGALALLGLRRLFAFRTPVVMWDLGLTETWPLRRRMQDRIIPNVDGVMVLGTNQKDYIEANWRSAKNVEYIGHYVDENFFVPQDLPEDDFILAVGDDGGRDYGTLIEASENASFPVKLRTGLGLGLDPQRHGNIEHLRDRVAFAGLRDLYARAAIVAVPVGRTLNASGVSSLLEAASMGKAMIVSDSEALRDYVIPDETCLVVPCHDPVALRQAIDRLLGDRDLRLSLGRRARAHFLRQFSSEAFAAGFAATLRRFAGLASTR